MKNIARAILDAQKIREESYDSEAAEKHPYKTLIDFEDFYMKSHMQAAEEAVLKEGLDKNGAYLIYLLNSYCWNDIQGWAESELGVKTAKVVKNRES